MTTRLSLLVWVLFMGCAVHGLVPNHYSVPPAPQNWCHYCVSETKCVKGECECRSGRTGDPYFNCYRDNNYFDCRLFHEPATKITTFYQEGVYLPVAGPTRIAQLTTVRRGSGGGRCYLTLFGQTERVQGHLFFHALEFTLRQVRRNLEEETLTSKIWAHRDDYVSFYRWLVFLKDDRDGQFHYWRGVASEGGPRNRDYRSLGCKVRFHAIDAGFLQVRISCCGIRFAIRPFHWFWRHRLPGVFVQVKKRHHPDTSHWDRYHRPLCLDPFGHFPVGSVQHQTGIDSPNAALAFLAVVNNGPHVFYEQPRSWAPLMRRLYECPKTKREAFVSIDQFMTTLPEFIDCISVRHGLDDLVNVLLLKARWVCEWHRASCVLLKKRISRRCADLVHSNALIQALLASPCPDRGSVTVT